MASPLLKPVLWGTCAYLLTALAYLGVQQLMSRSQTDADAVLVAPAESDDASSPALALDEASAEHKATRSAIADWQPNIDDAIDQLEEILITDLPPGELNATLANLNTLYDTQLYLTFIEYLANLPQEEVPAALREQQHWLATRKELIRRSHDQSPEGNLTAYSIGEVYLQTTRLRLDEISQRLPQ